jgi:hypothetical protein
MNQHTPTAHGNRRAVERQRRRVTAALAAGAALLSLAILAAGCSGGNGAPAATETPETIPQPAVGELPVAPEGHRVDLTAPTFSEPTRVDNPLFPISDQASVLLLGRVDGKPFRTEVTLLPETRIVEWQGRRVETLVSQYVAFLGGRIHEVAYDFYAQDDTGAVWYFGEDVFNFRDGQIADTHGTWIAGKDGPAAMIMPADPRAGDVYRPENIPGFVFEEVTVKAVDRTMGGPLGPVSGGLVIEELHMDGTTEDKSFAPGYGEFFTGGGGDVEALALAVPTDGLSAKTPRELVILERGASTAFDAAGSQDWKAARAAANRMNAAWETVQGNAVPARLGPELRRALETLDAGIQARRAPAARQAALDVARWSLDLQLRHRPVTEIDLARFDLWAAQLIVDAAAGDAAAVNGDFFTLDYVRDRIQHTLDEADRTRLNTRLEELNGAVADQDYPAAAAAARHLRRSLDGFARAS